LCARVHVVVGVDTGTHIVVVVCAGTVDCAGTSSSTVAGCSAVAVDRGSAVASTVGIHQCA